MYYYKHHIGDFIKDTNYLNNEEVGIYLKLIWLYYDTEKPLDNDLFDLSIKTNARDNEKAVERILKIYFELIENKWHHSRCDSEIADYHGFCTKQKSNGMLGGRPKKTQEKPTGIPLETQVKPKKTPSINHKPETINQIKKTPLAKPDGLSDILWSDFLTLRSAKKLPITQTALNGIAREAQKGGKSLAEAIQICCERGWAGFKAEWLKTDLKTPEKPIAPWHQTMAGVLAKGNELGMPPKAGETEGQYRQRLMQAL